jgi:hypothetical protein
VNDNRRPAIPVPKGGFVSNEDEARWLEETLLMRFGETLAAAGIMNVRLLQPRGLYDLLLLSLDSASKRKP